MPAEPTLFDRIERAQHTVADLYLDAIRAEPLMDSNHDLLEAWRALCRAAEAHLPPAIKAQRRASTTPPDESDNGSARDPDSLRNAVDRLKAS